MRRSISILGGLALVLLMAPAALADSTRSSNWAGYAVHGSHASFRRVFGAWRQPTATCTAGTPTYSSVWVGLGGYSQNSQALEQIGSEVDCSASGRVVSSAWSEIVPAASRSIRMTVVPGDYLTAAVVVRGHNVRLQINDVTRRTSFSRSVNARTVDISSAEWIVEAPSECISGTSSCQELTLANFGSAQFGRAAVRTTAGHRGSITDRRWTTTKISMSASSSPFVSNTSTSFAATPSALSAGGSAFTITYASSSGQATSATALARTASVPIRPGRLLARPGRAG